MFDVAPKLGAAMNRWYDDTIEALYSQRREYNNGPNHIALCAPVWGVEFMETLCNYCVPSILSEQNRSALQGRCTVLLFTDEPSYRMLVGGTHAMKKYGIEVVIVKIPQYVTEQLKDHYMNTFWVLGTAHSIAMQYCARWGCGFHMLVPDHVYCHDFFLKLAEMQEQHDVILQTSISCDIDPMRRVLDMHRAKDGSISIDDDVLANHAFNNMHAQTKQYMMNDAVFPDAIPYTQFQIYKLKDSLQIYTGYMNPVWLSYEAVARNSSSSLSTLDTRMPELGLVSFAVPGLEEGLVYVEMSDHKKGALAPKERKDVWIDRAWEQMKYNPDYMTYRQAPSHFPIPEQTEYVTQEWASEMQQKIDALLLEERNHSMERRIIRPPLDPGMLTWDIHKLA